jgi:hypothetical protein
MSSMPGCAAGEMEVSPDTLNPENARFEVHQVVEGRDVGQLEVGPRDDAVVRRPPPALWDRKSGPHNRVARQGGNYDGCNEIEWESLQS